MMIPLTNLYNHSQLSPPQKALPASARMASVRSGNNQPNQPETPFISALKQSSEHARKILKSVQEHLLVNHPDQSLSDEQLLTLLNGVQTENNHSAEVVWKLIEVKMPKNLTTNSPYVDSLKHLQKYYTKGKKRKRRKEKKREKKEKKEEKERLYEIIVL